MSKVGAQQLCEELLQLIARNPGGAGDAITLRQIEGKASHLRSELFPDFQYLQGKVQEVRDHAGILYSARKHRRYNGGAEQQARWLKQAIYVIQDGLRSSGE